MNERKSTNKSNLLNFNYISRQESIKSELKAHKNILNSREDKKDISQDFHSLKKEQSLVFSGRDSVTSITSQVTSNSIFHQRKIPKNLELKEEKVEARNPIEKTQNLAKITLFEKVLCFL